MARLPKDAIPRGALFIAERLGQHGHGAWIVGGCVRDLLRGVPVSDWDIATSALPQDVQRLFRRTVPTGIKHGTVTVLEHSESYEVTTLRGEGAYSDGRRPDRVVFVGGIEDDLSRRDFTVNAIAFDPVTESIVDPWGGVSDLSAHVLRAVRDPMERFAEDGLRVLRAARFVATLDMVLDPATEAAIRPNLGVFAKVSRERVLAEWEKACEKAAAPSRAFMVMRRTGMLEVVAPPLAALSDDVFERGVMRMDHAPRSLASRLSALCLEAGHEDDRRGLERWLIDLRASNRDRALVLHLLRTFTLAPLEDPEDVRRFMHRVGREHLASALALRRAEALRSGGPADDGLPGRIEAQERQGVPLTTTELKLTGNDLMAELRLAPSKALGTLLNGLLEHCLRHPEDNERERLLAVARTLLPAT